MQNYKKMTSVLRIDALYVENVASTKKKSRDSACTVPTKKLMKRIFISDPDIPSGPPQDISLRPAGRSPSGNS
jgi:hypothetical protein